MMAVAALSLAHQENNERLDALQHYQKALPALQSNLRSADDLSSDGAFLTHFLLLVYEVSGRLCIALLSSCLAGDSIVRKFVLSCCHY
jgi:hypothetical protein